MNTLFVFLFLIFLICIFIFLFKAILNFFQKKSSKKYFKKSGISALLMFASLLGVGFTAETIPVESIVITIPNYQNEYNINTDIPIEIAIFPENATNNHIKYISSEDILTFSENGITTGSNEGTCEIYVESGEIKSNTITIAITNNEISELTAQASQNIHEQSEDASEEPTILDNTIREENTESTMPKTSYALNELQQLYIDIDSSLSYPEMLEFINNTDLPYSEEKYNGSREIQVAFSDDNTAQKYNKGSGDYVTISYRYPKDENSINDDLDKYIFGTCCYVPSDSSLTLIEFKLRT